jgi:hypothetical protein
MIGLWSIFVKTISQYPLIFLLLRGVLKKALACSARQAVSSLKNPSAVPLPIENCRPISGNWGILQEARHLLKSETDLASFSNLTAQSRPLSGQHEKQHENDRKSLGPDRGQPGAVVRLGGFASHSRPHERWASVCEKRPSEHTS